MCSLHKVVISECGLAASGKINGMAKRNVSQRDDIAHMRKQHDKRTNKRLDYQ